jgi:hypothetical protein
MKSSDIVLESTAKLFEFEKISREIDSIDDVEVLRELVKCYSKMYMRQQEVVAKIGM